MAKTIGSYKGLWQQESASAEPVPQQRQDTALQTTGISEAPPPVPESAEQLAHRYRMLVLREHRYKLGRDLLETGKADPWTLAFGSVKSLGHNFRPWAHGRIFALACYLGLEISPEILQQLRHPLWMGQYRRSMTGLWGLLEVLAQKTGQKPLLRWFFRLFYLCPPLGILIYEKQLQSLLRKAEGMEAVMAPVLTKVTQGQ